MPGTNGDVYAIAAWDPDGAGPLPPRLAIGGKFFVAGDQVVENIASFDPATDEWAPIGNGLGTPVRALAALPNGDLVAGGEFVAAAMTQVDCVARWNGTAWLPMGNGLPGGVTSLLTMSNGDLIAAGSFTIAAGAPADHVARWNGAAWQPIGTPPTFYGVQTLFETASGALLVGGDGGILQWNGVSWSAIVGSPGTRAITQLPNGDLLASTHLGVARWNGATWQNWGPGLNGVQTLLALPNGGLLVGGYLSSVTFPWSQVFAYGDGTSWVGIGQDWGEVYGMLKWPNGDVYAVGTFANPAGTPSWRIGRWRNGAWSALGPTCFDRDIVSMTKLRNGGLVVAGGFTRTPDGPAWSIARWDGAQWSPLGFNFPWAFVNATAEMPNGDIIAAGAITHHAGVMRWNGSTWGPLGLASISNGVGALAVMPNGDLVVGGAFTSIDGQAAENIARWDGAAWRPLRNGVRSSGPYAGVGTLTVLPSGDLLAAGMFDSASGVRVEGLARWDGSNWHAFGSLTGAPNARVLTTRANGDVVVRRGSDLAQWTGTQWQTLGVGTPAAAFELPNGDLLVSGNFTALPGSVPIRGVARFDGTTWTPVGEVRGHSPYVAAMLAMDDGTVVAAGRFDTIASLVSPHFARLVSTCPATNTTFGSGCAGSGGANVLRATSLPWIGASWNVRATGLASNTFAARVVGFATQHVRLRPLLPPADPACELLVTPDVLDLAVASNGVATASLALPASPPLVGVVLHQQMIPFELDALGNVVLITATNGVRGVVGVL